MPGGRLVRNHKEGTTAPADVRDLLLDPRARRTSVLSEFLIAVTSGLD